MLISTECDGHRILAGLVPHSQYIVRKGVFEACSWGRQLDRKCPNVPDHGVDRHRLNQMMLIDLLDQQLPRNDLGPDSKLG
jgi:hypothetical protein